MLKEDYAAIQWLRENAKGQAVVVEAEDHGFAYSYYSRVSTNTGLPTLLGWANHEGLWRVSGPGDPYGRVYGEQMNQRANDIQLIYTAAEFSSIADILKNYKVTYVFFGKLEQKQYGTSGLAKLQKHLKTVFQQGETYVFEVQKPGK
jgi:uncharacterized membrane protein